MTDLLPPNATPEERALSIATARLGLPETALGIDTLWNPWECPEDLLPWLAWALDVDVWDAGWSAETKRRVIAFSISLRRRAGTVWAVREALKASGYADALLTESPAGAHWAEFDLEVDIRETDGISPASIALLLRVIHNAKPVSRHLRTVRHVVAVTDDVSIADVGITATAGLDMLDSAVFGARHNGSLKYNRTILHDGGGGGDSDRLDVNVIQA